MKLLIPVKRVIDYNVKVRVKSDGTGVETSNVNVVEEMVNMIATQRAYEINSKAVETSDQMLQRLAQL